MFLQISKNKIISIKTISFTLDQQLLLDRKTANILNKINSIYKQILKQDNYKKIFNDLNEVQKIGSLNNLSTDNIFFELGKEITGYKTFSFNYIASLYENFRQTSENNDTAGMENILKKLFSANKIAIKLVNTFNSNNFELSRYLISQTEKENNEKINNLIQTLKRTAGLYFYHPMNPVKNPDAPQSFLCSTIDLIKPLDFKLLNSLMFKDTISNIEKNNSIQDREFLDIFLLKQLGLKDKPIIGICNTLVMHLHTALKNNAPGLENLNILVHNIIPTDKGSLLAFDAVFDQLIQNPKTRFDAIMTTGMLISKCLYQNTNTDIAKKLLKKLTNLKLINIDYLQGSYSLTYVLALTGKSLISTDALPLLENISLKFLTDIVLNTDLPIFSRVSALLSLYRIRNTALDLLNNDFNKVQNYYKNLFKSNDKEKIRQQINERINNNLKIITNDPQGTLIDCSLSTESKNSLIQANSSPWERFNFNDMPFSFPQPINLPQVNEGDKYKLLDIDTNTANIQKIRIRNIQSDNPYLDCKDYNIGFIKTDSSPNDRGSLGIEYLASKLIQALGKKLDIYTSDVNLGFFNGRPAIISNVISDENCEKIYFDLNKKALSAKLDIDKKLFDHEIDDSATSKNYPLKKLLNFQNGTTSLNSNVMDKIKNQKFYKIAEEIFSNPKMLEQIRFFDLLLQEGDHVGCHNLLALKENMNNKLKLFTIDYGLSMRFLQKKCFDPKINNKSEQKEAIQDHLNAFVYQLLTLLIFANNKTRNNLFEVMEEFNSIDLHDFLNIERDILVKSNFLTLEMFEAVSKVLKKAQDLCKFLIKNNNTITEAKNHKDIKNKLMQNIEQILIS